MDEDGRRETGLFRYTLIRDAAYPWSVEGAAWPAAARVGGR